MASKSSVCKTILPNGIRIISERVPYVDSVSIGVWAMVGSIDEDDSHRGVSHFIEHMLFKGTNKRNARQIADEMDYLGGHLNAFTDKEFTCYYAKVLKEHLPKALDILSDMVTGSIFDPAEIEREKNVVLEEIKHHNDTPEESVHDLLAGTIWKSHRLGNSVIGLDEVIQNLNREKLMNYMQDFYRPNALLISAAGNVEHQDLVEAVRQIFGSMDGKRETRVSEEPDVFSDHNVVERKTEQVHFCLGIKGFDQSSTDRYSLAVIDSVLGGGMSSRLFQEIRENRGLAYSVGSYSASYLEAGMFAVYGGTGVENVEQVFELIDTECTNIGKDSITDAELERSQNQIRGALVLGQESMSNRMSRLAKSELYFGQMIRLEEIISSIMEVNKDKVAEVASKLFNDSKFALAAIGPFGSGKKFKKF